MVGKYRRDLFPNEFSKGNENIKMQERVVRLRNGKYG